MAVLREKRRQNPQSVEPAASIAHTQNSKFGLILTTARKLFLEQGYDTSSMDMVARTAGVSKATLYVYFQSKEALLLALVEHEIQALGPGPMWKPGSGPLDVEKTLRHIADSFTAFFLTDKGLALHRLIIAQASRFPEIGRAFYEAGPKKLHAEVGAFLEAAIAEGFLAVPDTALAATQFLSLVRGDLPLNWALSLDPLSKSGLDAQIDGGIHVFLAAYGKRPENRPGV
ncbi:TetR/AcrR family transcriptional regulator [Phyllobacterium chamaecytisi]|uniref:TetR/AcrR family transcriptional regulator n=1 Tax=Phyllobacterium chamaecytisi TaxID=2876082 RepID=UPI001CCF000B|nr:TetR/AcrR family transcriptional regulator [Phyllobacterium sp. KW56]MBZ9603225.1 TetR/AcrR family transcriptional regulator [Phyllobacterium sp. KW56]